MAVISTFAHPMLALYIHWPFCKAKCPYCDFNSHVRENVAQDAWRHALVQELRWYYNYIRDCHAELVSASTAPYTLNDKWIPQQVRDDKKKLSSIFFGGGTPSLMPADTVAAVIEEAEKLFGFDNNIEITLEANPTSVEAEKFRAFRAAGVNRVSLGIQSLTPRHLTFLGREHSAEEARAAITLAAEIFPRYSFDLIYALHDQSLAAWERELQAALTLAGKHLSLYQLTIEPNTQFYHLYQSGKLPVLSADESAEYYTLTQAIMEAAGLTAYEISNHAAPGEESLHNLTYWRGGEYLGIGPGAHGRIGACRNSARGAARSGRGSEAQMGYGGGKPPIEKTHKLATTNLRSPEKWLNQVHSLGHGQEEATPLTPEESREEKLMMGIRLREGITLSDYSFSPALLSALQREGLIILTPTHLIPTASGRLVLNSLIEKLLLSDTP